MTGRSTVRLGAVLLVALLTVPAFVPVAAAETSEPFTDGPWAGHLNARMTGTGAQDGISYVYNGFLSGRIGFDVSGGSVSGDWSLGGLGGIDVSGQAVGHIQQFYEGTGPLSGNASGLRMGGDLSLTQYGRLAVGGMEPVGTGMMGPFVNPIGPLDVRVVDLQCDVVVGDWETAIEQAAAQGGTAMQANGQFLASYQGEVADSDLFDRYDELNDDITDWQLDMLETGDFDRDRLFEMVQRVIALEEERRAGVDTCLFGTSADRSDTFLWLLSSGVQSIAYFLLSEFELTPAELTEVADVLLFFGLTGAGASHADGSNELTNLLLDQLQRQMLEELQVDGEDVNGDPCDQDAPCLPVNDATRDSLRNLDRLDLEAEVGGEVGSAGELLDVFGPASGGEGDDR